MAEKTKTPAADPAGDTKADGKPSNGSGPNPDAKPDGRDEQREGPTKEQLQAELDDLNKQLKAQAEDAELGRQVKPYVRKDPRDGSIHLDVPPGNDPDPNPDPDAEPGVTKADVEDVAAAKSKEAMSHIQRDQESLQTLEEENKNDPLFKENLAIAKQTMKKVPMERRSLESWRTALNLGAGKNKAKYQKLAYEQGIQKGAEDTLKSHNIRVPRSNQVRTVEQEKSELTPRELEYCQKSGKDPEAYARSKLEMRTGKRIAKEGDKK